jgi:hypothetical protein
MQIHASLWILFASSLVITGLGAFDKNHSIQVPLVRRLVDPSLYPHDPFVAAVARYPSALWPLVALGARVLPLEGLLITLVVLERFFVLWAAGRLARAFAPGSTLALVASTALFAFAVDGAGPGGDRRAHFEQTGLAIGFLLLAMAAFFERRLLAGAILLAIAFNLNPLYGVFALSYFGATLLVDAGERGALRKWILPLLLFLALSSHALWAGLSAMHGSTASD